MSIFSVISAISASAPRSFVRMSTLAAQVSSAVRRTVRYMGSTNSRRSRRA